MTVGSSFEYYTSIRYGSLDGFARDCGACRFGAMDQIINDERAPGAAHFNLELYLDGTSGR